MLRSRLSRRLTNATPYAARPARAKPNYLDNSPEQYAYDAIYQLTQVTRKGQTRESYMYDDVGISVSAPRWEPQAVKQEISRPCSTLLFSDLRCLPQLSKPSNLLFWIYAAQCRWAPIVWPGMAEAMGHRISWG